MDASEKQKYKFTNTMFGRLFGPAIISSLGWALSDMADAVVVGQRLGTTGLAAISFILPVYMINCTMAHGFGVGGTVRFSNLLSKGKKDEARANFSTISLTALFFSVLTAVLGLIFIDPLLKVLGTVKEDGAVYAATKQYLEILVASTPLFYFSNIFNYYLRNDENQKLAAVGSVTGNICDIFLNIFLVLILGLGTRGAALSTSLGQVIAIAIYVPGLLSKKHNLRITFNGTESLGQAFSCFRLGFGTSITYLWQMIFFLICNNLLMRIGGEESVAVFDVLQNTSYLILYLYEGTARAMQPLASTYHGEENERGKIELIRVGFLSGIGIGTAIILFIEFCPQAICMLFGVTGDAIANTSFALRVYAVGAFFAGINILLSNYYQSCEQERTSYLIENLRGAVILIPAAIGASFLPTKFFWFIFPLTEVLTFVIYLCLRNVKKYKIESIDRDRVFDGVIFGNADDITRTSQEASKFCEKWKINPNQQYFVTMAIEEIGMSIVTQGMKDMDEGFLQITLIVREDGEVEIHLRDNAVTFDPFSMETSRAGENENFDMDAMGVFVIKNKAKDFHYRHYQGFNSISIVI